MAEHPFPWRGLCRYCGRTLSTYVGRANTWQDSGGETLCPRAPEEDGDPGHHYPRNPLSENGHVPSYLVPTEEDL